MGPRGRAPRRYTCPTHQTTREREREARGGDGRGDCNGGGGGVVVAAVAAAAAAVAAVAAAVVAVAGGGAVAAALCAAVLTTLGGAPTAHRACQCRWTSTADHRCSMRRLLMELLGRNVTISMASSRPAKMMRWVEEAMSPIFGR